MSFNAQFAGMHAAFKRVTDKLDAQDRTLDAIKVQTTATNGRVTKLETGRKSQRAWLAGAAFAAGAVVNLIGWLLHK